MANEILSVSLPARFLSAGQCFGRGSPEPSAFVPGSFLLLVRESVFPGGKSAGPFPCRQVLLLPSGTPLPAGFGEEAFAVRYWLQFIPAADRAAAQVQLSLLPVPLDETSFDRLACGFHQLIRENAVHPRPSDLCDFMLSTLLLSLQEESRRVPRTAAAAGMLEYIRLHCCERLTLPDLSRALGYSEDYLSRLLHDQVSCTFREYIHRLRMQRAKRELLSSSRSIREIAEDCGYPNPKFFSTSFMKLEGLAPSAFRNLYASGFRRGSPEG